MQIKRTNFENYTSSTFFSERELKLTITLQDDIYTLTYSDEGGFQYIYQQFHLK